tara:strand:- start:29787 stop:30572 length:786 start_codon:yes stop_codon:yes gene_type:complete
LHLTDWAARVVPSIIIYLLICIAPTLPALGQEQANELQKQGLPPSPAEIGRLKRGSDGKIIQIGPADTEKVDIPKSVITTPPSPSPNIEAKRPKSITPRLSKHHGYNTHLLDHLQNGADHQSRAHRQQIEIDSILRDEARAKKSGAAVDTRGLTAREIALMEQLQRRHREVTRHEMDHFRTGQPYASFPQYYYVRGPLNRQFAVSGIVKFDASLIRGDVSATVFKLEKLRRAALAPRTPSSQDRQIAAELSRLISILKAGR